MSTRATYQFTGGITTTLYIHHDGYPEGSASYLHEMLCHQFKDSFFLDIANISAESMLRANHKAMITASHDVHGDTEYRYNIDCKNKTITALYDNYNTNKLETIFHGSIVDFINKYRTMTYQGKEEEFAQEYFLIDTPAKYEFQESTKEIVCKKILARKIIYLSEQLAENIINMDSDNPNLINRKNESTHYIANYRELFKLPFYSIMETIREEAK